MFKLLLSFDVDARALLCILSLVLAILYFNWLSIVNLYYIGYYADPEADCQVFHICTADGQGGLAKYSFLCPNGTIFNQEYFICDWWFNVDCAEAAALAESRNAAIAAERSEVDARNAEESLSADESAPIASYEAEGGAEEAPSSYGAALDEAASEGLPSYAEQPSYSSRRRF